MNIKQLWKAFHNYLLSCGAKKSGRAAQRSGDVAQGIQYCPDETLPITLYYEGPVPRDIGTGPVEIPMYAIADRLPTIADRILSVMRSMNNSSEDQYLKTVLGRELRKIADYVNSERNG